MTPWAGWPPRPCRGRVEEAPRTTDALNRFETVTIDWLGKTATYQPRITTMPQDGWKAWISLTAPGSYLYDDADRLMELQNAGPSGAMATYALTLDANGNRTVTDKVEPFTLVPSEMTIDYTYNQQRNRLLTAGVSSFAYDADTFDYEHRLTGAGATQYSYDGANRRLETVRNGVTTRYIYDVAGNLLAEADGNNVITRYYIYGQGLLAMVTPSDDLYCYHFDAVGSTIAVSDELRTIVNQYAYTPFGIIMDEQETVHQPFKYVGQHGVMTEQNGFLYMRARYYDPNVGRFISEDPMGFDGGDVNLYVYAQNDPVLLSDPSGLWTLSFGITISGGLGLGGGGGTFLNIGHDPSRGSFGGWSASLTGTAQAGAFAGTGVSTQFVGQVTNANNVSQLEGSALVAGKSAGVGVVGGVEYIQGAVYKGFGISGGFGIKSIPASPVSTYAFGSTTSKIVGYEQGK